MTDTQCSTLSLGRTSNGFVVRICGRGTMKESRAVQEIGICCLDAEGGTVLTVDLSRCEYLDSTFLGCLVSLHKRGKQVGRQRFFIAASVDRRKSLLSASRFDRFFDQVDAAPEEISEPKTISPTALNPQALGRHIMECHQELAQIEGPSQSAFAKVAKQLAQELVQQGPANAR